MRSTLCRMLTAALPLIAMSIVGLVPATAGAAPTITVAETTPAGSPETLTVLTVTSDVPVQIFCYHLPGREKACSDTFATTTTLTFPDTGAGQKALDVRGVDAAGTSSPKQRFFYSGGTSVTEFHDWLTGTPRADSVHLLGGDDSYSGVVGNDRLWGDAGNDYLNGGRGNDVIAGGVGSDQLVGMAGNDTLAGDAGPDTLYGQEGNDKLTGGAGNDKLIPGDGKDSVAAGAGNDYINAFDSRGAGETINCGPGRDRVWADKADKLIGCEVVARKAPPSPWLTPGAGFDETPMDGGEVSQDESEG